MRATVPDHSAVVARRRDGIRPVRLLNTHLRWELVTGYLPVYKLGVLPFLKNDGVVTSRVIYIRYLEHPPKWIQVLFIFMSARAKRIIKKTLLWQPIKSFRCLVSTHDQKKDITELTHFNHRVLETLESSIKTYARIENI